MKKHVVDAVNEQIRAEFQAAYFYLAYAGGFDGKGLPGFSGWMRKQWDEELTHALKLFEFLLDRGEEPTLLGLQQPSVEVDSPASVFERVLSHEKNVTRNIHELYELAKREDDYPLQTLLHWFIDEQVEEEDMVGEILARLQLIGDSGTALFLLDKELGER